MEICDCYFYIDNQTKCFANRSFKILWLFCEDSSIQCCSLWAQHHIRITILSFHSNHSMGKCRFHSFAARFYFEFISLVCAGFRIAQSICAPSNRNFFLCPQESYHHLLIFGEKAALYFLFLSLLYLISLFFNINIFVLVAFFEFLINFCSIFYVLKSCFFFYFIVIRDHLYHLEYSYFK